MRIRYSAGLCVAIVVGLAPFVTAASLPVYRGRILESDTKRPMPGLVVEALLRDEALPTGERMVGRTKTNSEGRFVLQISVPRRDIALVVSKKGSTSKLIDFGGEPHMMTDTAHPLAIETHPSSTKENIIFVLVRGQKKK